MPLKFNDKEKNLIMDFVQKNSWKEDLYNSIDKLEAGGIYYSSNYTTGHNANPYHIAQKYMSHYQVRDILYNYLKSNLLQFFKSELKLDFISNYDNNNLSYFVFNYLDSLRDSNSALFNNYKLKLVSKLGNDNVEKWLKEFSNHEILSSLHEIITESVKIIDSHRYNDDIVECFLNVDKDYADREEKASDCQYKLHGMEVAGENLSTTDEL